MTEPEQGGNVHPPMRRLNPTLLVLLAGVVILILLLIYVARTKNPNQDKLRDSEIAQPKAAAVSAEKRCSSQQTYELIKRELFRRAAQMRGSDQAAYDRLSAYAVVRMENPVLESQSNDTGAANCSGSLSLDLPPGVAVVGGRRTLMADVDYTVQPAADDSGTVVVLRNADAIIAPLATLARTAEPQQPKAAAPDMNQSAAVEPGSVQGTPVNPPAPPASESPRPAVARPSFDCGTARTRGEIAVCSDAGLAALDRNMAAQYSRAASVASPDQRDLLKQTARRFYAYRDRCGDNRCIGDAYVGRMREIRDIMEGRWQAPR